MDETDAKKILEEIQNLKKEHEKLKEENEQLKRLLKENSIIVPSKVVPHYEESKLKMEIIPDRDISRNEIADRNEILDRNERSKKGNIKNNDTIHKPRLMANKINPEKNSKMVETHNKYIESNADENSDFDAEVDTLDFEENYCIVDNFVDDACFEDMNEYEDTSHNLRFEPMFQKAPVYENYENNMQRSAPANTRKEIVDSSLVGHKEEKEDMSIISFLARSDKRVQILKSLVESDKIPSIISKEIGDSNHHVSKYLKNLKEKGLVVCLNEEDKRFRFYSITPKGKKYLKIMENKKY